MPKHHVKESFVDKETGERYEKNGKFEAAKARCSDLVKKGFLGDEIKDEPQKDPENFPAGKSEDENGADAGAGSAGE